MIKLAFVLMVVAMMIMSCSTSPSANHTRIEPSCLQGHWYYFDENPVTKAIDYYEAVFSQDTLYAVFTEYAGWYGNITYDIKGDSLLIGNEPLSKYILLTCDCDQLVLATSNEGEQSDTLVLKPYDMGYWLAHQNKFSPKVRAYYSQEDENYRAFMMRLKEGFIHYEDLDSAGNSEVKVYFEDVEPILEVQQK